MARIQLVLAALSAFVVAAVAQALLLAALTSLASLASLASVAAFVEESVAFDSILKGEIETQYIVVSIFDFSEKSRTRLIFYPMN